MPENESALPVRMLHDRILVSPDTGSGERRSSAGILIPATAQMGKRLAWATVAATGPQVRQVAVGEKVLFDPEDHSEVELEGIEYILLRERDIHAVAQPAPETQAQGLYL